MCTPTERVREPHECDKESLLAGHVAPIRALEIFRDVHSSHQAPNVMLIFILEQVLALRIRKLIKSAVPPRHIVVLSRCRVLLRASEKDRYVLYGKVTILILG